MKVAMQIPPPTPVPTPEPLSPDTQAMLECLQQTAIATLERKRRLGHYAVLWSDDGPVLVGEDAPASF